MCTLLSSKCISTSRSLSSILLTSLIRPLRTAKASEYSLFSTSSAASLASSRCLGKLRLSARVHCTISLQIIICRSELPGISPTESITLLITFAVCFLGIKEKKNLK
ncbi:hypothetical protein V8G54_035727 [Vigna mungo]|uniref:Uncharacterized protein n=1 Tax=Vigna mungo TaxID=3915 RepID=A0AAQ3RBH0_VIGMU